MHRRSLVVLITLATAACASCVDGRRPRNEPTSGAVREATVVPVTAERVTVRQTKRRLKFVGTLFGAADVTLSSQVEGQIRALHADLGDRINAGQILAEVEDDQLRAKLRELEAMLAKTRADERRGRELVANKVISPQEYEAMKTAATVTEAQRDTLSVMIAHTRVVSPLTGAVAARLVSPGEYVRPGTPLFRLVADQPLKLRGDLPERYAQELAVGQPVEVTVDAHPSIVFTGTLSRISPSVRPETRSVAIEAIIENPDRKLKPGFFANAAIITRTDEQALLVPERSVLNFAGVTKVFVVRDNVAHQALVRTGAEFDGGMVEIVEGLYPDELIVTSGLSRLEHGTAVIIQAEAAAAASADPRM